MWWNDGNGTWFCQAPRKAPRSPAAWPPPLDTSSLLWSTAAHRLPASPRAGWAPGGDSRSACPSKEQTGAGAGADGRTEAQPRSAPAPPASGRAALPQPVRQVDRFKLRSHRLSSFIQRDRCTQGRCPVVSWKGPGPRSFPRVAASPQVALLAIIPLPPTTSTLPLGEECEHRSGGADVSPGP